MRVAYLLLALLLFAPLAHAQKEAEPKVDLSVAFPSTTMVYLRVDTNDYFDALNPEEMFAGLESDLNLPDLGEIARDRLELKLTDEEVSALARGVRATAMGLLDVAVSGPKFEIIIEHQHLGALARALKQAQAEETGTVPGVEDYYGNLVYEIEIPLPASAPRDDFSMELNPMSGWMSNQAYWVSILNNHYLIIATSDNAVKDAIDYLSFPDDPIDTLLGNARYKEAVADFEKPQGLFFVNIQSVINTMERLTGDKGSSAGGIFEMLLYSTGITAEQVQFMVGLLQYEQFKSFAAGFWLDEEALTLRMDANLVFHNAPGWFSTVRIDPKPMPLTEFIPANSMLAITDCVEDVGGMYERVKGFFFERCKAAGQQELADRWSEAEQELNDKDATLAEALGHFGGGQAIVVIPREKLDPTDFNPTDFAFIMSVKDRKAAEEFFFGRLLGSRLGQPFAEANGELSPVTIVHGVEIHHDTSGNLALAFLDGTDTGVFVIGNLGGIKSVVNSAAAKGSLMAMPAWQSARQLLWEAGSAHLYINFGAMLRSASGLTSRAMLFGWDDGEEDAKFDRDDTEKDEDPIPFLSDFFGQTIVVGSARSHDKGVNVRLAAAGWPDRTSMRGMALHYRDVERNRQIRDDFVRIQSAASAHFAIKGEPAKDVMTLVQSGNLIREEWAVDPYGADAEDGKVRSYLMAEVPKDVDIRQAILCAYQRKPGLRGNFLGVLWNTHVVEMTPVQLAKAIELAKQGQPLPADGDWYRDVMKPLHESSNPREEIYEEWPDENQIEVEIIDDEGNESTVEIDAGDQDQQANLMRRTEDVLKAKDKESD